MLDIYEEPFCEVQSYHLLMSFLDKKGLYIEPIEIIIGRKSGKMLTAQYVPLSKTLEKFLTLPSVLQIVKNNITMSDKSCSALSSFLDGELWKEQKQRFAKKDGILLPFLHYYDDFETCNPLGSRAGVHKLGGNYSLLLALPPRFNSVLENLFLSTLFYSTHRDEYSNKSCYAKIIEDYNYMATEGKVFTIYIVGFTIIYFGFHYQNLDLLLYSCNNIWIYSCNNIT